MLYGELSLGSRPTGRPASRFKDACKRDMKACDIDTSSWETAAHDRTTWRKITRDGMKKIDKNSNSNGRRRETNHHLHRHQTPTSNATTAAKSVAQESDFTVTGLAAFNDFSKRRHHCQTRQTAANKVLIPQPYIEHSVRNVNHQWLS